MTLAKHSKCYLAVGGQGIKTKIKTINGLVGREKNTKAFRSIIRLTNKYTFRTTKTWSKTHAKLRKCYLNDQGPKQDSSTDGNVIRVAQEWKDFYTANVE
mmetsp:Transcript_20406/g.42844  ORF Transcript_20406/g.42844 Transcript_20406/m.42844 type:complete len:100 (+) Transcript_20406:397-696(+)|eukprot:CAMPEP_0172456720 /NCGR_PEP_ID=MMETSP1065-20121228/17440_1 /TAXON_ID=265537 /ORGANISM="Amphiprora paludosa, Strain CCMP125" /LENGTH=99 /DNA_ID=CAMNT_0013209933 /DNA_START=379 /DNA_END=678 /DNA_ORIENTATION=+